MACARNARLYEASAAVHGDGTLGVLHHVQELDHYVDGRVLVLPKLQACAPAHPPQSPTLTDAAGTP